MGKYYRYAYAIDLVEVDVSDVPGIADLDDITGGLVGITQAGTEI